MTVAGERIHRGSSRMVRETWGSRAPMEHDPRPRFLAGGAIFLVAALVALIAGAPLVTLLLALVAAGFFYFMTKVSSVP
jgi:hypothetical protein